MNDLIIIGAGGFGKEVAWLAKRCGRNVMGFLDNTKEKQNITINNIPVLGNISECIKYMHCDFVIAIGSPRSRKKIVETYFDDTYHFATLIDPSVIISDQVNIGEGVLICAGVVLTVNITIGNHVIVNLNSTIGHDVIIGDYVTIAPNVSVSGNIRIDNLVELGTNSTLREKLIIDQGVMVGMGAVVTKNLENNSVVVGNPAKLLKVIDS